MASALPSVERLEQRGLDGSHYRVEQNLIRNKYTVYDEAGEPVLEGKQKLLKLKEEFPFQTPDGEPAFTVKAQQIFDFSGDYAIQDPETDEIFLVLRKEFTIFHHKWAILDPDGELLARAVSRNRWLDVLRHLSTVFSLFPYRYDITAADGSRIGEIKEHFSLRDKYDVTIEDPQGIPQAALVAAGIVIDAMEGQ